jgi:D-3-phosphoglycerate dehydrogenase / 2-oxoglutarate reductase
LQNSFHIGALVPLVAVTDYTFESLDVEMAILEPLGCRIAACKERSSAKELGQLVAGADAVITQFAPLTAEIIEAMQKARVIARYGIGVDNVDLEAARAKGIPVCNVPDYCIDEVADHTLAFILATTRQVVTHWKSVRVGDWKLATGLDQMRTLRNLTVGIVGFGRIGRAVAMRLKPFQCRIVVHDPALVSSEIETADCQARSFHQLLAESDLISLHCPSTAQTRGMINHEALARMKPGVILVNVARGDLIDSAALTSALQQGHISATALDVFAPEPIHRDHPILEMDQVILSPHIASASVPAMRKLRTTVAGIVASALRGERLPNVVNGVSRRQP